MSVCPGGRTTFFPLPAGLEEEELGPYALFEVSLQAVRAAAERRAKRALDIFIVRAL